MKEFKKAEAALRASVAHCVKCGFTHPKGGQCFNVVTPSHIAVERAHAAMREHDVNELAKAKPRKAKAPVTATPLAPFDPQVILDMWIPGRPQAWQRAGKGEGGQSYTDPKHRSWMQAARHAYRSGRKLPGPYDGPVLIEVLAVFDRPSKLDKADAGRLRMGVAPDASNVLKIVEDAINHSGVWKDDCRVSDLSMRKRYAAVGEEAGVFVRVTTLDPAKADDGGFGPARSAGLKEDEGGLF